MTVCLRNRQQARRIDLRLFRRMAVFVLQRLGVTDCELCFHFVEAGEMARLNEKFLDHVGPTDVISFDYAEGGKKLWGEIFICVEVAVAQARQFQTTWQSEVVRYAIHGMLHLRGYDDRKREDRDRMKREENRLLAETARHFALKRLQRAVSK